MTSRGENERPDPVDGSALDIVVIAANILFEAGLPPGRTSGAIGKNEVADEPP